MFNGISMKITFDTKKKQEKKREEKKRENKSSIDLIKKKYPRINLQIFKKIIS